MKYSFFILLIMTLFSCNKQPQGSPNIYVYGTEQFDKKSNELKYSLNDAIDIYCDYLFKTTQNNSLRFYIRIIYEDNYVFSQIPYNEKTGYCYLDGYWINGETGQISEVNTGDYLKIDLVKYAPAKRITKEEFYRNKEKQKP